MSPPPADTATAPSTPSAATSCPTDPAQQPVHIEKHFDIWNPGGHPEVLRAAADAWRAMATELDRVKGDLLHRARGLQASWTGDAADAFEAYVERMGREIDDALGEFRAMAGHLDDAANEIKRINDEVHRLYIEVGVTVAAGAALTVVTLGFSDAAAAAETAAAASRAAALVADLANFIARIATVLRASRLGLFAARWAVLFGANLGARVFANVATGERPFDISMGDLGEIAIGSLAGAGFTHLAMGNQAFAGFAGEHRLVAAAITGGLGNAMGGGASSWALRGEGPTTAAFWREAGISGAAGAVSGPLGERLLISTEARLIPPSGAPGAQGGLGALLLGPDGEPLAGRDIATLIGPNGEPLGGGGRVTLLGADGRPLVEGGSGLLGPDGRPMPPGGRLVLVGPDGQPLSTRPTLLGVDGRPLTSAPAVLVGPDGQPLVRPPAPTAYAMADEPSRTLADGAVTGLTDVPGEGVGNIASGLLSAPAPVNSALHQAAGSVHGPKPVGAWDPSAPSAPAPAPAPAPVVVGGGYHTVVPGDSLSEIARRQYGDASKWTVIARANPQLANPDVIQVGTRLVVPPVTVTP